MMEMKSSDDEKVSFFIVQLFKPTSPIDKEAFLLAGISNAGRC